MRAEHTPARVILFTQYGDHEIRSETGELIAVSVSHQHANARRLVACWNACEGLYTESLERGEPLAEQIVDVLVQRDELKGEILVVTMLLREALNVVMNVEAESADEDQMLANLITKGNDAIKAVLTKHALPGAAA